ncbi:uncharacterized protein PAC_02501 [Phialocephala subalpina]|uniref:Uncharacterized protein n=1 Tax=Phialocephala subalpina TaxID=576137 RepID=A0A1L7WIL8_9HELO|nr:uncharacterized protein PAC_02501 [Phialocephala subalpina]
MAKTEYQAPSPMSPDHHEDHPQKPTQQSDNSNPLSCLESFFGIFKNMFGCIKNGEEALANAPPQIQSQLPQSLQAPPQQTTTQTPA